MTGPRDIERRRKMSKINLTTIFYPQLEGGYTVVCPELGLTSQGEDMGEATQMIKDLIDDYFKNDKTVDFNDYVEGFNAGHKIITDLDYEYTRAD